MILIQRIIEKEDQLFADGDFVGAGRLLQYWLAEAEADHDLAGMFFLRNEQMGLYRKTGKQEEAFAAAEAGLALIPQLGYENSVSGGTCYINAATVYKAFGEAKRALPLYQKAKEIYEVELMGSEETDINGSPIKNGKPVQDGKPVRDGRLGGLYNNMALALLDEKQYTEAEELFQKALAVMEKVPDGQLDAAITWLNLADLHCARDGYEKAKEFIETCLNKAERLLHTESIEQGNYAAFVYEKCAPIFGYYYHKEAQEKLQQKAKAIHERTGTV